MKLSDLSRYGLIPQFLEQVKAAQGETLLPLQSRMVLEQGLLSGRSLWVLAPPSAGKTFLAELAFLKAIEERKKTIFAVPLKALAEEKFVTFRKRYGELGVRVVLSTRDHPQSDSILAEGNFDLAIVIYEKLNQLLVRKLDILSTIGLLAIDEGQLMLDSERGEVLEKIFFKYLLYPKRPQLLVLSAGVANFSDFSRWLGCHYIEDSFRPVPLKRGVLAEGRLRFYLGAEEEEESWPEVEALPEDELWIKSIERKVAEGEAVLVFRKSKKECEDLALILSSRLKLPPADNAQIRIKNELFSNSAERLWRVFEGGVAFHHADLLYSLRRAVEEAFRGGEIKVVVATSTLAWGVNLPAGTVFVDSEKFEKGPASGEWISQPISLLEYENMAGRAGRLGFEKEGKAILIARTPLEKELFWNRYVLRSQPMVDFPTTEISTELILDLVASGAVSSKDELLESYLKKPKTSLSEEKLVQALSELEQAGLVKVQDDKLFSTPLGKLAASSGFSVESFAFLYTFVSSMPDFKEDRLFDLIYSFAELSQAAGRFAGFKGNYRMPQRDAAQTEEREWEEAELPTVSGGLEHPARTLFFLSLYADWKSKIPLREIESKYRAGVGDLLLWADGTSWVLETARDVAQFLALPADWATRLDLMAFEIRFGLPARYRPLVIAFADVLFRDHFFKLIDLGCATEADVAALPKEKLQQVFGAETGLAVYEKAQALAKEPRRKLILKAPLVPFTLHSSLVSLGTRTQAKPLSEPAEAALAYPLYLDGAEDKNRFLAVINGVKVYLPAKLFFYLFELAKGHFTGADGWVSVYDFEKGEGQGRFVFRLKKEIEKTIGKKFEIENNRRKMYRLRIRPEEIGFDLERLANFPDSRITEQLKALHPPAPEA